MSGAANILYKAGITFGVEGARLWVEPAAAMTPELLALVRENKDYLVRVARFRETLDEYKRGREIHKPDVSPAPPGRDPMVHTNTDKARFFRGVRERDLEKRRREGLPPWIRVVDGGKAS